MSDDDGGGGSGGGDSSDVVDQHDDGVRDSDTLDPLWRFSSTEGVLGSRLYHGMDKAAAMRKGCWGGGGWPWGWVFCTSRCRKLGVFQGAQEAAGLRGPDKLRVGADTEESSGEGDMVGRGPSTQLHRAPAPCAQGQVQLCPCWQEEKGALAFLVHSDQEASSDLGEPGKGLRHVVECGLWTRAGQDRHSQKPTEGRV